MTCCYALREEARGARGVCAGPFERTWRGSKRYFWVLLSSKAGCYQSYLCDLWVTPAMC
ncbi:hypothetical protein BN977_01527 [Mycolicibacterium cosmeticum]|uniref:Uncharacterized protein n=1 Tax=Mycolicibacterium cosmeticum TaxID=258533 RepID=W9ALZ3_MYCCO|nr:hypothetical protein BN977_01527 [Mycolicibacterium cosmeticum]